MIINTGQRTDIPAFYAKWFINRIKEGYVLVRNPYYPKLITKFLLNPKVVDVIGFCTKNPRPMFQYLDYIKDFAKFWHITITCYDKDLEPHVPCIAEVIEDFKFLSNKIGNNSIVWRYTPIIINKKYTVEKHINTFRYIAEQLEGYTSVAVFGFIDLYDKLKRNHPELIDCSNEDKIKIAVEFSKIAKEHNLDLRLCSKEKWLEAYGINTNGCMTLNDYERSIDSRLIVKSKMESRKGYCACYLSNDIGSYNSCLHFCQYCYANGLEQTVIKNYRKHDDDSPLLIGNLEPDDQIKEAKQESYKELKITLF